MIMEWINVTLNIPYFVIPIEFIVWYLMGGTVFLMLFLPLSLFNLDKSRIESRHFNKVFIIHYLFWPISITIMIYAMTPWYKIEVAYIRRQMELEADKDL
jgi:hypothetical protein